MNILIVGNGFDLSHYLPTKYDHFMDVMDVIDNIDIGINNISDFDSFDDFITSFGLIPEVREKYENSSKYALSFEELFEKTRDKTFIKKTMEFYLIDDIQYKFSTVLDIKFQLSKNSWYQYFKKHVNDVKTWIDFEQKIEEVLICFANVMPFIEKMNFESKKSFSHGYSDSEVGKRNTKILGKFNFFIPMGIQHGFNTKFCDGGNLENGFNPSSFLNYLQSQLDEFIKIFNLYLELVVRPLVPVSTFSINSDDWVKPDKIFSFNYTNTYQRLHKTVDVEYLHSSHGIKQNIVLGVSDLEDESLKKIKAYGFTKYHQKLFKDTDYLFLDRYKKIIQQGKSQLDKHKITDYQSFQYEQSAWERINKSNQLNLNFHIWGHSLDVSDKDYIIDLFGLNDDMDRNVRVTVYHFNKNAKFDLLNNLLAILGKDKVEHWMKNKWLQFKENPKIVAESAITLEDLPKT